MSAHIDRMRRAIEFESPDYVPMELVDIPHLYDAYGTRDPAGVRIPAGAEGFDSAWCTYHWTFEPAGATEAGEPLRRDEWGCTHVIPHDRGSAYAIVQKPEPASMADIERYPWPDPAGADWFFESRQPLIARHYADRFICGFLDPGPFLIAFNLFGYEGLLMNLCDRLEVVKAALRRIVDYQIALVPKFRAMGAHMVNVIDEIAGTGGLMFSPAIWREHFKPMYAELFAAIHRNNLYTACLFDGDITAILPDLTAMELDQLFFAQPLSTGIDTVAEFCRGKTCAKMAVDMMVTLADGSPAEIRAEVDEVVRKLRTPKGGLVFQALRWFRPEYDAARVHAQIEAFNAHRQPGGRT
ncbi:MAG: hypothetical protein JXR37_35220 [Kiritimatiellae bacterium]|nr:hypothetical protein [Kiritimatiellia bacterium]